jgi:hypothetical protein
MLARKTAQVHLDACQLVDLTCFLSRSRPAIQLQPAQLQQASTLAETGVSSYLKFARLYTLLR